MISLGLEKRKECKEIQRIVNPYFASLRGNLDVCTDGLISVMFQKGMECLRVSLEIKERLRVTRIQILYNFVRQGRRVSIEKIDQFEISGLEEEQSLVISTHHHKITSKSSLLFEIISKNTFFMSLFARKIRYDKNVKFRLCR